MLITEELLVGQAVDLRVGKTGRVGDTRGKASVLQTPALPGATSAAILGTLRSNLEWVWQPLRRFQTLLKLWAVGWGKSQQPGHRERGCLPGCCAMEQLDLLPAYSGAALPCSAHH